MKDYQAYLFDWDGTLAQTVEIWVDVVVAHLADYGIHVTTHQASLLYGDYTFPVKLGLPAELNDQFHAEIVPMAAERLAMAKLYEGASDVLQNLKDRGKKLALISSSRRESIDVLLGRNHLEGTFDAIVSQTDIQKRKPDPEGLLLALGKLQVTPDQALVLGDTINDLKAAANDGADSLLFCPRAHYALYDVVALEAAKPTYTIGSWQEFLSGSAR